MDFGAEIQYPAVNGVVVDKFDLLFFHYRTVSTNCDFAHKPRLVICISGVIRIDVNASV